MTIPSWVLVIAGGIGCLHGYELHEWGTFTTVSGSDGQLLSGLQREEEHLPPFVHSHLGMENGDSPEPTALRELTDLYGNLWPSSPEEGFTGKGLGSRPVANVTVKMETPVIYFHSEESLHAKVKVDFNGGTISQWYPARSGGETLPLPPVPLDPKKHPLSLDQWRIDFAGDYHGGITWDVDVLSRAESKRTMIFKPRDTLNWVRARVPEANVVRIGRETEGYLFYRGIGNFKPGLEVKVTADEKLQIRNLTGAAIPYLLVYQNNGGLPAWRAFDQGLATDGSCEVAAQELELRQDQIEFMNRNPFWWSEIQDHGSMDDAMYQSLKAGLTRTGLLASEADAMIQTWWKSYFENANFEKGVTRVFWILPQNRTDQILPLQVEPPPERIVRVMVGRSEILRPSREKQWLELARKEDKSGKENWLNFIRSDRFGLAIKERVKTLSTQISSK